MNRGEVWWVNFDPSTGTEIKKTRPAVIVSTSVANNKMPRVIVLPVTSNVERIFKCHALVNINGRASKAMADQIFAADKSRLKAFICKLTNAEMVDIDQALKFHLGL